MIERLAGSPVEEHAGHNEPGDDGDQHHCSSQPERLHQDVGQSFILIRVDEFDDDRRLLKGEHDSHWTTEPRIPRPEARARDRVTPIPCW